MSIFERTNHSTTTLTHQRAAGPALLLVREGTQQLHPVGVEASERLRAEEYVVRRKWLSPMQLPSTGGETDRYDNHATHFAVRDFALEPTAKALATVRFVKPTEGALPVLELFPELSTKVAGAHEVSRYISLLPSASRCIRAVIIAHLLANDVQGVAVISPGLGRLLSRQSLVLHSLSDQPRTAPMYGSQRQVAVEVDAEASARKPENAQFVELALARNWSELMEAANDG